jgi:hypothetical protein
MSMWHAYADRAMLERGAKLLVTGGHEPVRLQTADQITIETPDHNRLTAVVVDRSHARLLVAVGDGPLIRFGSSDDVTDFKDFKLSDGFSRESWAVL